jgi:carbonic anhydrase
LTQLLPAALGLKNGDAKIIKNAGGVISHPFGSVMRSLLIGIYELDVREILVIGHTDCGARHTDSQQLIEKMKEHGIEQKNIDLVKYCGVSFDSWLGGFIDLDVTIRQSVEMIRNHPLVPKDVSVYGLVIDSVTGELKMVTDQG